MIYLWSLSIISISLFNLDTTFSIIVKPIKSNEKSLEMIARKADGSMRDALSILDQIICYCNNDITFDKVQSALGIVTDSEYYKLLSLIGCKKTGLILESLKRFKCHQLYCYLVSIVIIWSTIIN